MRLRSRVRPDVSAEVPQWERLSELEEYRELCRVRLEHVVEIRQPWVLVSQVQRSGGTLLSQLFDGHPECHSDPWEVKVGHPRKEDWPPLDLGRPETWFEHLQDPTMGERLRPTDRTKNPEGGRSIFPFLLLPRLQKAIFDACVASREIRSERDLLDCYFTSYFNAWIDNQNLYTGPKRVVAGFTPGLSTELSNVERFFGAYPDGTLISIVREPRAWYLSASRFQSKRYREVAAALGLWRASTEAALAARERFGDRVLLLTYERLVREPEQTMRCLADRIGITMLPVLLEPTFNGLPVRANSSGSVEELGIRPERVDAYREVLDGVTLEQVDALAGDLYERAAALVPIEA